MIVVKPVEFEYIPATDLEEAVGILNTAKDSAKVLSGGQSLLPVLNMRLARPKIIVDINKIHSLNTLTKNGSDLLIGAVVRHSDAERSPIVKKYLPLLSKALPHVGHSQIRNRGTVVGSLVHADPSAEVPLVSLLLDAKLEINSLDNKRIIPMADFYYGYMMTDLQPEEIVTSVTVPIINIPSGGSRGTAFLEVARREGDFALVEAACQMDLDSNGVMNDVRLGVGGVGPAPIRLLESEERLRGKKPSKELFKEVSLGIDEYLEPDEDPFVPIAYREQVAKKFALQVLDDALEDALRQRKEGYNE
jgi:CO/xanthine dehydrogenase FAD-binding subunit